MMIYIKKAIGLFFFLVLSICSGFAQNLVSNNGFESGTSSYCSTTTLAGYYQLATGWNNATNFSGGGSSADLFCKTPSLFGTGFTPFAGSQSLGVSVLFQSMTEGATTNLTNTIFPGATVSVSLAIHPCLNPLTTTNNNEPNIPFGLYFYNTGTVPSTGTSLSQQLTATPQFVIPTGGFTTGSWSNYSSTFVATGTYNKVAIAFFNPNGNTIVLSRYFAVDNVVITATIPCNINANAGANKTTTCSLPSQILNGSQTSGIGAISYSWSPSTGLNNPNIASPTANPPSSTTYTLTVTDANGCTDTDQVVVTVNKAAPNANAGSNKTTTCTTPTAVLNGSGGGSYVWNNGASNIQSPTVNPSASTTYTLTVTGSNGCTDTDQAVVTVNKATPTANAGADKTTTCSIPTAILNGSGGGSYVWNNGASNVQSPTVNPSSSTTYTLTVTGSNGCTDTDQVVVTVNKAAPTANAGADILIDCATTSTTFTASGSGSYSWSTPSGSFSGATVAVDNSSSTGTYTLTVTGSNGCTNTDVAVLSIDQVNPVANAGLDQISNCATPTVTLDGSSSTGTGLSYSWSGSGVTSGGSSSIATANTPGAYILTVTGTNFCTDTDNVQVTPDTNYPTADAGLDQIIDCNNTSVVMDGSGSDSGSNMTYLWSTSNGNITTAVNTTTIGADLDATYTLSVTNMVNGCTSTDNVVVSQDTVTPIIQLVSQTGTIDCNNPTLTLDATNSTGVNNTFNWTTPDGNIVTGENTATPIVNLNGTYMLSIVSGNGCSNSNNLNATILIDTLSPTLSLLTPDTLTCNILEVTVDGSNSQNGVTYLWSTNTGNIIGSFNDTTITVDLNGFYSLQVMSSNGCISLDSIEVVNSVPIAASIQASPLAGEIPLLVNFSSGALGNGLTYSWDFDNGESSTINSPITTYETQGEYIVTLSVEDNYGCITLGTITINALEEFVIPGGFSPNTDGYNDVFIIKGLGEYEENSINIFNRWGNSIFSASPYENDWNGQSNSNSLKVGDEVVDGTYFYILKLIKNGEEVIYNGSIELKRK